MDNKKVIFLRQIITKHSYHLLLITVSLALFFFFLRPPLDPDLGWHLKYGQMMVEGRQLPRVDNFSYTMSGYPWADSYWLSEVLIYLGYKYLGFLGLAVIFSLIATVALLLSFEGATFREGKFKFLFILFIAVLLIISFVGIRPQTISLFFFAMTLFLLHRSYCSNNMQGAGFPDRHSGRSPESDPGQARMTTSPSFLYLWLPLLFLLWANLHAGFVLGLAVVWLHFLGEAVTAVFTHPSGVRQYPFTHPKGVLGFLRPFIYPIGATLATLVNPYGWQLWQSIGQDAASLEIKRNIMEWLAPTLRSDLGWVFFAYLVVLLLALGASWPQPSQTWPRLKLSFLLPLFFLLFLSLTSLRHIPLLVVLSASFLGEAWPLKKESSFIFGWALFTFFGTSLFAFGGFVTSLRQGEWTNQELRRVGVYPYRAVQYLREHPLGGRVLNTYGWGGYLLWQQPDFKTFIDGRMPGWRRPGQPSLFREYLTTVSLQPGWETVLQKYQVTGVILEKSQPLLQALALLPAWRQVYEDEVAVILVGGEEKVDGRKP